MDSSAEMAPARTTSATTTRTSRQLFQLAQEEEWQELENRLQSLDDISVLEEPYGDQAPEPTPPNSCLLHVVCSFASAPLALIESLLSRAPQLATRQDDLGRNPLHVSLMEGSSQPGTVRVLARAAPEAAQQRDDSYCTPIEVLTQMILMQEERTKYIKSGTLLLDQEESNGKVARRLWECVQPLAVASCHDHRRADWESPLLHACLHAFQRGSFPFALMERARKLNSNQYQQTDSLGNYPLHILAGWDPEEDTEDYLWAFAKEYPKAAKLTNLEDMLPLDIALSTGMRGWDTGIAQLLEIYPAPERFALGEMSYMLGKAAHQERWTLVFEILRNQPQVFAKQQH